MIAGQTKVADLDGTIEANENVRRLDVAVHTALCVDVVEPSAELAEDGQVALDADTWTSREPLLQRLLCVQLRLDEQQALQWSFLLRECASHVAEWNDLIAKPLISIRGFIGRHTQRGVARRDLDERRGPKPQVIARDGSRPGQDMLVGVP